jgi:hypothetical protein
LSIEALFGAGTTPFRACTALGRSAIAGGIKAS